MVDNIQSSPQRLFQRKRHHIAAGNVLLDQEFRQYRHAQPFHNGLDQRLRADALPSGLHREPVQREIPVQRLSSGTPRLPHQKRELRQLLNGHFPPPRERGVRRHDGLQLVPGKGDGYQLFVLRLGLDQPQIDAVVQNQLLHLTGAAYLHVYVQRREFRLILPHQLRQKIGADGDRRPDADGADGVPVPHPGFQLIHQRHHMDGVAVKFPAALRGGYPASHPLEQRHAVVILQFPQRQTHRGLGQMQRLGSLGHAVLAVDLHQNLHMPQRHSRPPFISFFICISYHNSILQISQVLVNWGHEEVEV